MLISLSADGGVEAQVDELNQSQHQEKSVGPMADVDDEENQGEDEHRGGLQKSDSADGLRAVGSLEVNDPIQPSRGQQHRCK